MDIETTILKIISKVSSAGMIIEVILKMESISVQFTLVKATELKK